MIETVDESINYLPNDGKDLVSELSKDSFFMTQ